MAIFKRGDTKKRVTILAMSGEDCPGEQSNNFLDVSPATANKFRLINRLLYFLEFNTMTKVITISLRKTEETAPFEINGVNVKRNGVFLVTGETSTSLNLQKANPEITVKRAGKEKK